MRFMLDTNTLIYAFNQESEFHSDTNRLIKECLLNEIPCFVLISSIKDAYYTLSRHYKSVGDAKRSAKLIFELFYSVDLTNGLMSLAFECDEADLEDAIIRAAAEQLKVDAIVSYDRRAFKNSSFQKVDALQALEMIGR